MKSLKKAFSLVELLVVVAVMVIIVGIGVPALRTSRQDSIETAAHGQSRTLNDAKNRAIILGDTNPLLTGNDLPGLANYLLDEGYLQPL